MSVKQVIHTSDVEARRRSENVGRANLQAKLRFTGTPGSENIVRVQVAWWGLPHGAHPPRGGYADAGAPDWGTRWGLPCLQPCTSIFAPTLFVMFMTS